MAGPRIHSDHDVSLNVHDSTLRSKAGIGSIIQVHSAFESMFHHARRTFDRTVRPVWSRAQRTAHVSASDGMTVDPVVQAGSKAQRMTLKAGVKTVQAPSRTVRGLESGYEHVREADFRLQKFTARRNGLPAPQEHRLPATPRQRRAARRTVRKETRRARRLSRLTSPARTRVGTAAKRIVAVPVRAVNRVRRIRWAVASAPWLGVILVVLVVVASMMSLVSQAGASTSCAGSAGSSGQMGDDYYYGSHGPQPAGYNTGTSPMGYEYGNCTDFVAWRVNRDDGSTKPPFKHHHELTPKGGNGGQWGDPGNLPGWSVVPQAAQVSVGDIVSFKPGVDGSSPVYGHVGYVGATASTSITTENYGRGRYFTETIPNGTLQNWIASGQVTVKHNPKDHANVSTSSASGCDVGDKDAGPATQDAMDAKKYAMQYLGNDQAKFDAVDHIFTHESGWRWNAYNPQTCGGGNHAYGIPQSCPGDKMSSEGADWQTNAKTQVRWGIKYMRSRYGGELQAWQYWQVHQAY